MSHKRGGGIFTIFLIGSTYGFCDLHTICRHNFCLYLGSIRFVRYCSYVTFGAGSFCGHDPRFEHSATSLIRCSLQLNCKNPVANSFPISKCVGSVKDFCDGCSCVSFLWGEPIVECSLSSLQPISGNGHILQDGDGFLSHFLRNREARRQGGIITSRENTALSRTWLQPYISKS